MPMGHIPEAVTPAEPIPTTAAIQTAQLLREAERLPQPQIEEFGEDGNWNGKLQGCKL